MSSYKSFAVAGAGTIGTPIVNALLDKGASVVVLSRNTGKPVPTGAAVAAVDYADVPALTATLKSHAVDVVISTFGRDGISVQPALADAAKAAGVQLFIPSEFGVPTAGATTGVLAQKDGLVKHLVNIGLPYARIYTGFFTSFIPWLTGITDTGKVHVIGKGETPISVTAEADIAGFIAHITTSLPPAQIANHAFRIQGERVTQREIAALFNKPIVYHDAPPTELSQMHAYFLTFMETGVASTGYDFAEQKDLGLAGEANALWPGHNWATIKEIHKL